MTPPTTDIVERLAREAGLEVHPRKGEIRVGLDAVIGIDSTDKVRKFAALVLEEAAKTVDELPSFKWVDGSDQWGRPCPAKVLTTRPDYSAAIRALAAGVR